MPLMIGQPIDARDLEQATSQWSPERFASMCNDVVWAASGRQCPSLPSFTARVNAADGGIDAEWDVPIPQDDRAIPAPILGPGWNVFQYKKRDLLAQDRRRIISKLKSSLNAAIVNIEKEKQRYPDRYILFVNIDLTHDDTTALKKAIMNGYNLGRDVYVEVVGAAELASLLNDLPHLRAVYFTPLPFQTWGEANRLHRAQKLFRFDLELVGRESELNRLRSLVDDPFVRAIVVTGPHDIGKSRLVLEATRPRLHNVVFALDLPSMSLQDWLNLVMGRNEVICVVEDPDPDKVEPLVNEVLGLERLKVIITLPTADQIPAPIYGQDDRVQSLALGSLSDEDSRKLLNATGKHLDFGVESWILDQAGGNPGILLAAASVGEKLRVEADDFARAVGREFEKRIGSELGRDALKSLELLSPLTHVGVSGKFESELKVICDLFGDGWQTSTVLSQLGALKQAGLAKRGGSFAEVTIPILANYLAAKLLHGRKNEVFALFGSGRLDRSARLRFVRRLSQVRGNEVTQFWDALFDPNEPAAPFGSFRSALDYAHTLRIIAATVPEHILPLLKAGIINASLQERSAITGEQRREVIWTLEELLFRGKTSAVALRCIAMLAEAENENYGNNATGVFCESFHPVHPQLPLSLQERLDLLKEFISASSSTQMRLIAIKAVESALSRLGAVRLRRSSGPEPLDSRPHMTYGDVWDYIEGLLSLLMTTAQTENLTVMKAAADALPHVIAECAIQARPEVAIARFRTVSEWALTNKVPIPMARLVEGLRLARDVLGERKSKAVSEMALRLQKSVEDIDALLSSLDKGDFPSRLKRWAGHWTRDDHKYELDEKGSRLYRSQKELQTLADEAVETPEFLTDDLLTWLCSDEAKRAYMFFQYLGRKDVERKWQEKVERLGENREGLIAFSAYFGGLGQSDETYFNNRLDELVEAGRVTGAAIVNATGYLPGGLAGVRRTTRLIREKRIDSKYVGRVLSGGGWMNSLTAEECLCLLEAIAGPNLENAAAVIDFFGMWLHSEKPLECGLDEFAWRCLEATPPVAHDDIYDFNKIASKLAQVNPDRGFKLLERLLTEPSERHSWNPIDRYGARENGLWEVLHKVDRERALRIVLSLALRDPVKQFQITWDFQDIVDQQGDRDLLIKLALENEKQAKVIAESITTAHPEFWPIAFKIVERYPGNESMQSALTAGIEQMGQVHSGPYSLHLMSRRNEVERVLNDPKTLSAARLWLRDVLSRFETEIAQQIIWEYDEDANDLRRYIEDKESPERIWAIGRVLKYAEWKDIRRLLSVEDIEEALPQVDLPAKKRRSIERALEVWRGGS